MTNFHLAQVNIARMAFPLDSAEMAEFVALLASINAIADAAPGFVWRLQSEAGNATHLQPYDDDRILFNMSVWTSLDALVEYVYRSGHVGPMRRRREWFVRMASPSTALWWVTILWMCSIPQRRSTRCWARPILSSSSRPTRTRPTTSSVPPNWPP